MSIFGDFLLIELRILQLTGKFEIRENKVLFFHFFSRENESENWAQHIFLFKQALFYGYYTTITCLTLRLHVPHHKRIPDERVYCIRNAKINKQIVDQKVFLFSLSIKLITLNIFLSKGFISAWPYVTYCNSKTIEKRQICKDKDFLIKMCLPLNLFA